MALDEEQSAIVAGLEQDHGTVAAYIVPNHGLLVVGRCRNPAVYKSTVNTINGRVGASGNDIALAQETFVVNCVLHPEDKKLARAMFRDYPALVSKCFNRCYALSGGEIEEMGKD